MAKLSFYSDRDGEAKLWIWSAASDKSRPVSEAVVRPLFVWKLDVGERTFTRITRGDGPPIKDVLAAGHGRLWSPDAGGSAIVATRDEATKRVCYVRINLQSGPRARLLVEDKHYDSAIVKMTRSGPL
jgi:hypothetical protein